MSEGKLDRRDFLSAGLNLGAALAVHGALAADSAGAAS